MCQRREEKDGGDLKMCQSKVEDITESAGEEGRDVDETRAGPKVCGHV